MLLPGAVVFLAGMNSSMKMRRESRRMLSQEKGWEGDGVCLHLYSPPPPCAMGDPSPYILLLTCPTSSCPSCRPGGPGWVAPPDGVTTCSRRMLLFCWGWGKGRWEHGRAGESLVSHIRGEHRLLPLPQHSPAGTRSPATWFCKACQDLDGFAAHFPLRIEE